MSFIKEFTLPIHTSPLVHEIAHSISKLFNRLREDFTNPLWLVNQFLEKGKLTDNINRKVK